MSDFKAINYNQKYSNKTSLRLIVDFNNPTAFSLKPSSLCGELLPYNGKLVTPEFLQKSNPCILTMIRVKPMFKAPHKSTYRYAMEGNGI